MIDNMTIDDIRLGEIPPEDWRMYRNLWLEALQETPQAFLATYEEEQYTPDEKWQSRIEKVRKAETQVMVFAYREKELIGMMGAYINNNPKVKHIADVWTAYVKIEHRKKGVAKKMMVELLKKVEARPDIKKIKVGSIQSQHLAVNLYKEFGFEMIGIYKQEIHVGDKFYDEYIMEKIIR